ncbi:MAG: aspartate aminotransferase family protein [Saprospiraceae bacterium]
MNNKRITPIEIEKETFKNIGYQLVDRISNFVDTIENSKVTTGETPIQIQELLEQSTLPEKGTDVKVLLENTTDLLLNHSLFNGHPKFLGYITSSATPIGGLADLLAATVNANVGANILSPVATEIEKQTISWLAEFIGLSSGYGGLLVSGGNMANFTAFLAARTAKAPKDFKEKGFANDSSKMLIYCADTTHTWIEKAAILFGHGRESIRWIPSNEDRKMNIALLSETIQQDLKAGHQPFMVVGTGGDVSTGAVDDLSEIAEVCKKYNLWFHIDGAYGVPAVVLPEMEMLFKGMGEADSIAIDPHKWLYSPLEAGCTLVKNPKHLIDTYSAHPEYYNFQNDETNPSHNFYEYGLQNSRGFRALKVWMALKQVGKQGYVKMIREDIALSRLLFDLAEKHSRLEAVSQNLSITTLRYISSNISDMENQELYLNILNEKLLNDLQKGGEVFLSNAIVLEKYCLRACIVNFRTSKKDIEEVVEIIVSAGKRIHDALQQKKEIIVE